MGQGTTKIYPGWRDIFGLGAPGIDIKERVKRKLEQRGNKAGPVLPTLSEYNSDPGPLPQPTYKVSRPPIGDRDDSFTTPVPHDAYMKNRYAEAEKTGKEYVPYFSNTGVAKGQYRLDDRVENFSDLQPASGGMMITEGGGRHGYGAFDPQLNKIANIKRQIAEQNSIIGGNQGQYPPAGGNYGSPQINNGQGNLPGNLAASRGVLSGLSTGGAFGGNPAATGGAQGGQMPASLLTPMDNYGGNQQAGLPVALAQAGQQVGAMMQNPDEKLLALRERMMKQDRDNAFLSQKFDDPLTTLSRGREALGMNAFSNRIDHEEDRDAYYNHAERMAQMNGGGRRATFTPARVSTPSLKGKSYQEQNAIMNDPQRAASIRDARAQNAIMERMAGQWNNSGGGTVAHPYGAYQPEQAPENNRGNAAQDAANVQMGANRDAMIAGIMADGNKSKKQAEDIFKHIRVRKVTTPHPTNLMGDPTIKEEYVYPEVGPDGKVVMKKINFEGNNKDWLKKMREAYDESKKDKK